MKLIKDWKNSWKYQSNQIAIWGQVLQTQWLQYPELQEQLPQDLVQKLSPLIQIIVILARIIDFKNNSQLGDLESLKEPTEETKNKAIQKLIKAIDKVYKKD